MNNKTGEVVFKLLKKTMKLCIPHTLYRVGGLSRGKDILKDLDILIVVDDKYLVDNKLLCPKSDKFILQSIIFKSKKIKIVNVKTNGGRRKSMIIKINNKNILLDIFICTKKEKVFQLVARIGPKELNIIMRRKAKNLNMLLNEYGLFNRKTNKQISNIKTQKDIFEKLGMSYKTAKQRKKYSK